MALGELLEWVVQKAPLPHCPNLHQWCSIGSHRLQAAGVAGPLVHRVDVGLDCVHLYILGYRGVLGTVFLLKAVGRGPPGWVCGAPSHRLFPENLGGTDELLYCLWWAL